MTATEFQLIDAFSNQATKSQFIRPAPLALLGPFTITATTPGLTAGVPLVTLPFGALIYDIGVVTTDAWDGTTPLLDVGTFTGNTGLFGQVGPGAVDVTDAWGSVTNNTTLFMSDNDDTWLQAALGAAGAAGSTSYLPAVAYATEVSPLFAVVSQDGTKGGTATGATTGTSLIYVLAATPITS